ncbi:LPS-assembly lipoprotein LptE [Gammaproteobacteria bacterium]
MKFAIGFIWLTITVAMTGCDFHLRGAGAEGLPPMYIDGDNHGVGVRSELVRVLRSSGGKVVAARDQAQVVLQLTYEDYQRWPLSISRQLLVQEYELIYVVGFQLTDPTGTPLAPPQSLNFTRDYSFADTTQILGKGNEESLLRQEMVYDASRQILAQVVTILDRKGLLSH